MFSLALLLLPSLVVFSIYLYAAIDAWRLARQTDPGYALRDYNRTWIDYVSILLHLAFSIALVFNVRGFIYQAFVIPVNNMIPTILAGDRVLVKKLLPEDYFLTAAISLCTEIRRQLVRAVS